MFKTVISARFVHFCQFYLRIFKNWTSETGDRRAFNVAQRVFSAKSLTFFKTLRGTSRNRTSETGGEEQDRGVIASSLPSLLSLRSREEQSSPRCARRNRRRE